jgi:hypothetical protein
MLIEKYVQQQQSQKHLRAPQAGEKRHRSLGYHYVRENSGRAPAWDSRSPPIRNTTYHGLWVQRDTWRNPRAQGLTEKSPTLEDMGHAAGARSNDTKAADDVYVLVGAVPCRLASEVHVNGRQVNGLQRSEASSLEVFNPSNEGINPKRPHLFYVEGRKIIRPSYSTPIAIIGAKKWGDSGTGASDPKMMGFLRRRKEGDYMDSGAIH